MQSIADLSREYVKRAQALGLEHDVLMDGVFNAQVAVIAEAPGSREVQLKVPLVGGSGQLLWNTLRPHGITRRDVYVTNVVKRQLAFGGAESTEKVKIPRNELDHWYSLLRWELACLPNLKYVLILGNMALECLCGKKGITKWRGSVLDFQIQSLAQSQPRDYKAVCTFNPAAVIREPKSEISFIMDCAKLPLVAKGTWKPYVVEGHVCYEYKEAAEVIDRLRCEAEPISFDIETGFGETACIGLANNNHVGYCIPFRGIRGEPYHRLEEEIDIRLRLQRLFHEKEIRFIAQNANFDMYWLWIKDKLKVHATWFDTMLAHHCLYPALPHDLGYLCTQYTNHPYYKDEREEWKDQGDIYGYFKYNITDVCITRAVAGKLHRELVAQGLDKFFFEHIMRLQPHLVRMTVGGVRVDETIKTQIAEDLQTEVGKILERFRRSVKEATGDDVYTPNPNSPRDMSELYFRRLRLIGRGTSTDKANRKRMFDHPRTNEKAKSVLRNHEDYSRNHKFLSTYAESKHDEDQRMRCEWRQTGTQSAPGRLSSGKTLIGTGMNLQNQPTKARSMFIADKAEHIGEWYGDREAPEDYCFWYFDLSQAEARYVAWEAVIPSWKEQFEKARLDGSYDCHRALASDMFNVPYDEVPTADETASGDKTMRFIAKRCRHGLNYRMAPDRLAETTGLSIIRAHEAYTLYHRLTPELRRWWQRLEREARDTKMLYNCFGRRLYILERITDESLESIVAFKPQSSIGDKVSQVIYQCHDDDEWPIHARVALNVHDALVGLSPISKAKTCLKIAKKYAESPLLVQGEQLIIPAEVALSYPDEKGLHRWSNLKKIKDFD